MKGKIAIEGHLSNRTSDNLTPSRWDCGENRDSTTKQLYMMPNAAGTISRLAYAHAVERGANVDRLLRKAGLLLSQINDTDIRLEVRRQIKFLNLVAETLNDDFLGFHLAQNVDLRKIGLFHYLMASSDTLDEGIQRVARYSSIVNQGMRLTYRAGKQIRITCEYVGVPRHLDHHQIEFWATALMKGCREHANRFLTADRVSFVHRRTRISELKSFYRCELRFCADIDEAAFPLSFREVRVVTADPNLNKLLIRFCEEALAHRGQNRGSLETSVENALAVLLPHGKARLPEVARKLTMGRRTLARRLASEGLTFSAVLHELRSDLAKRHLADQNLSISQVAWLLGYSDVSAFSHAHKRRTGTTPRAMRHHLDAKRKPAHAHASH
jgi:AraC-like DNA-binding protein